jgi:sulfatase modifying factor 1
MKRMLVVFFWFTVIAATVRTEPESPGSSPVTNSVGMKLVLIPPGTFVMGSPDTDSDASEAEKPAHRVQISRAFYLAAHETTVGNFRAFVDATGYKTEAEQQQKGYGWDRTQGKFVAGPEYSWKHIPLEDAGWVQGEKHPVINVSWNDAIAFCRWLSQKEGKSYRLPTEAEWEYSCRAGTTSRYYAGDSLSTAQANFGRKAGGPLPVGTFEPNPFGLYDMHGNVWEFCADWHDDRYYHQSTERDPSGPSDPGSANYRVRRGGDWLHAVKDCRAAARYIYPYRPQASYNVIMGFRIARDQ